MAAVGSSPLVQIERSWLRGEKARSRPPRLRFKAPEYPPVLSRAWGTNSMSALDLAPIEPLNNRLPAISLYLTAAMKLERLLATPNCEEEAVTSILSDV